MPNATTTSAPYPPVKRVWVVDDELKPGAIWGGWWLWEAPVGKVPESPEDTLRRLNPLSRT